MNYCCRLLLCLTLLPLVTLAEDNRKDRKENKEAKEKKADDVHEFERTARQYTRRSRMTAKRAANETDPEVKQDLLTLSEKFARLATYKREALEAQKAGKSYNWDTYQQTRKEVGELNQELKARRNKPEGKEEMKKPADQGKDRPKEEKKKPQPEPKEQASTDSATEKPEAKPAAKTFQTQDGFLIRTSL